jgi:hypothetical protein
VNDFYKKSILILDKISNKNGKTSFIVHTKKTLTDLITSNKKLGKEDYNPSIQDFLDEVSEIERIYKGNYNRIQRNREEFICKHLNFQCFVGFCYSLRNQYVHNGLIYNLSSPFDNLYVQGLQSLNDSLNHLLLTFALSIFKAMNGGKKEKLSITEKNK